MKFLKCKSCGNLIIYIDEKACTPVCCGQEMEELTPNTTDAATEKHVPVVTQDGQTVTVKVGSTTHPMLEKHYIQFIALETNEGFNVKYLKANEAPEATFVLNEGEEVRNVYEYCNLHGLWKA